MPASQQQHPKFSRRDVCSALIGGTLALAPTRSFAAKVCQDAIAAAPYRQLVSTPLGDANPDILWGTHLEGETIYDARLIEALGAERPRVLAIGSGLKFGALHPLSVACEREDAGKTFSTWTEPDDIVTLASRLGAQVRSDALIWNDWLPTWITQLANSRPKGWKDQLQEAFERHIADVLAHFDELERQRGARIMPWCGIVNEPFEAWGVNAGGKSWRQGAWADAFDPEPDGTPGYISKAFEFAEKYSRAEPRALYLNEAGCESDRFGRKLRQALLKLVGSLKAAGRKIDAVGLESHLMPQWMDDPRRPNWRPFTKFLDQLAALGVAVYITELDVNDCSIEDMAERDRLVADYTQGFVTASLESKAVTMVTNWDFSDNYSWLRDNASPTATFPTLGRWANCGPRPACPRPTIYDQQLAPKPSRDALAHALSGKI
jgi:endo-1,4-beta-xylanase